MDDQAIEAVASDPMDQMMEYLEAEDEETEVGEEPEAEETETGDEESDEATEEEAAPAAEEFEEITHNGEVKKLSKSELKELAQQGFDYTQKTQQLAEQRRQLDAMQQSFQQQAQIQAHLSDQLANVKAIEGQLAQWKQVNWTELAQTDPMQYLTLNHQYSEAKEAYNNQIQTLNYMQSQVQTLTTQQQAQRLQMEAQALKQAIPEWKDGAKAEADMGAVRSFLASNGFNDAEIASVMDHRHVVVARKAMLYDQMMKNGKAKVASAPPVAKPGSTASKPTNTSKQKVAQALKKTGRSEYAAKLIEGLL